ncbi:MAG: AAA family ATPase [Bacteroidota bacterium]|jgi:AAA15 family ATPase/GTPase
MEANKHLTSFSVENFKCFETFELKSIGQFNLIAGDNNVGKTSLLEALLLETDLAQTLHNLNSVYAFKHNLETIESSKRNYLSYFININTNADYEIKFQYNSAQKLRIINKDIRLHEKEVIDKSQAKYAGMNQIGEFVALYKDEILEDVSPAIYIQRKSMIIPPVIPNNMGYTSGIVKAYSRLIDQDLKNNYLLVSALRYFIPDIEDIRILKDQFDETYIVIQEKGKSKPLPITSFGDGTLILMRLMLRIMISQNQRLMIDEIDTGIHYSRMKDFLRTIIHTAKEHNVQLFATTHSKECIEAYSEVIYEFDEKTQTKSRFIRLEKLSSGRIIARNYNYDQFSSTLELGNEIRS